MTPQKNRPAKAASPAERGPKAGIWAGVKNGSNQKKDKAT
jgi:hypothetical protein